MPSKIENARVPSAEFEPVFVLGEHSLREPIIVKRACYKQNWRISIRHHYVDDEALRPTRRGIEVPEEFLDELIETLQQLQTVIRSEV